MYSVGIYAVLLVAIATVRVCVVLMGLATQWQREQWSWLCSIASTNVT